MEQKDLALPLYKNWESMVTSFESGVEQCHDLDLDHDGSVLGEMLMLRGIGLMITNSS